MFCPKCGIENPETGKFCRTCGTDLGNVSDALSGKLAQPKNLVDRKGRPINWEGTITTFFMGVAFLIVSIVLGVSGMGRGWWFWMLIPAFGMLGSSVAKYVQLKKLEQAQGTSSSPVFQESIGAAPQNASLPPAQTQFVSPAESRYKTGDLVPPSVTESTTKLLELELDPEGQTRALPKK